MANATQPSAYLEQEPNPDYSLLQEEPADCSPLAARCECHSTYQFYEFDENVLLGCFCFVIIAFGLVANLVSVRIFTHKLMSSHCINWYLAVLTTFRTRYSISSYCYGLMTLRADREVHVVGNCYRTNIDAYIPYTLLMFIVPFSILIVVNTAVLVALRRSNRLHSHFPTPQMPARLDQHAYAESNVPCVEVGGGGVDPLEAMEAVERHLAAKRQEAKERQTTAVLVALVVVFLCCNLLAFLANIMENLGYDQNAYYGVMITYTNFLKYRLLLNAYVFRALKQRGENELLLSNAPVSL
ncbi:hypothetical protein M3Y99_01626200 [Aphelenchoides fujianensis]|nr:hypothetical protein M3Y99_01626200 [Aphelenchoides fujianensis]